MPHMVIWNFYFLLKLYLFVKGAINLDVIRNLLFLAFVIMPLPQKILKYKTFRVCRGVLNIILAFLLLWHDSWLPPILDAGLFLNEQGMPSFEYIISFIRGIFNMTILLVLALFLLIGFLTRKYKIAAAISIAILIITVPIASKKFSKPQEVFAVEQPAEPEIKEPAKYLEAFYSKESERVIMFKEPDAASPPFDIVILHVCSLSWDDLKEMGMTKDSPFFKQFDYLFTNFNTATGYSGPAVIRLLQANCGQKNHSEIQKKDAPKICLVFESLTSVGYEPYMGLDHDGKYGNFNDTVKRYFVNNAIKITPEKLPASAVFFDKSLLYSDYDMLKKWFDTRQTSKSERAAFYYNSVLLHAGSHWIDEKKSYLRDKKDQFEDVSAVFLKDVQKFIDLLKSSKRNTLLVFVPEHGRALTSSPFQPADLRDIPLPKITKVPVGIKFIGPKFNDAKTRQNIISKPTSYLALSWALSKFIEHNPFGNSGLSPEEITLKIPKTEFVSEHEKRVIIEMGGNYLYYGKDKKWITLTPEQLK